MKSKALFLDRDGILNQDKGYVYLFKDIVWVNGIFSLIEFMNKKNYKVIVLTNQSGVAQGMYQEADVLKLHSEMDKVLKENKAVIDDWFYCTEYDSPRRKPRPGMMIEARDKYNIDLSKSFMIGDKITDILEVEGPTTFLLKGNYSLNNLNEKKAEVFESLSEILVRLKREIGD